MCVWEKQSIQCLVLSVDSGIHWGLKQTQMRAPKQPPFKRERGVQRTGLLLLQVGTVDRTPCHQTFKHHTGMTYQGGAHNAVRNGWAEMSGQD